MTRQLLIGAFVLAGCVPANGRVDFTTLNPAPHPMAPRQPQQVEVFENSPPARAHVDVGSFQIAQWGGPKVDDFRVAAANRGCDGVVIYHHHDSDEGVCIVYTDSPP